MLHPIRSAALDEAVQTAGKGPVVMLNLLRFHPGGRERYFDQYVPAFRAISAEQGFSEITPIWLGQVQAMLAGPEEERWDAALLVRYPSITAFRKIAESDAYRTRAAPHHEVALRDWRLIAQTAIDQF